MKLSIIVFRGMDIRDTSSWKISLHDAPLSEGAIRGKKIAWAHKDRMHWESFSSTSSHASGTWEQFLEAAVHFEAGTHQEHSRTGATTRPNSIDLCLIVQQCELESLLGKLAKTTIRPAESLQSSGTVIILPLHEAEAA